MPAYKTKALCIKNKPFSESDKLVTIFSREYGKIKVIAKSARRIPSRLGGRVETFCLNDFLLAKGRSLDIVSQCEVLETFQAIREDGSSLMLAYYLLKIIDAGTSEGQKNEELFDLIIRYLFRIKVKDNLKTMAGEFEKEFLQLEGIYRVGIDTKYLVSDHLGVDLRKW
ncbi:MAG: DNA repair protein RecO [Candidatus Margulisiibacteriota bacterium]